MDWIPVVVILPFAIVVLTLELKGVNTTLRLSFKGDIKRESAFLAQWGQSVCTPLAAWLVFVATRRWEWAAVVIIPVAVASLSCLLFKRLCGRMRPNRPDAGKFTGFSFRHDNARESFPSSHSACAFALSATLVQVWPAGYATFFTLAWVCAILRWLQDAHFPSDVLFGIVIGYVIGNTGALLLTHWFALV